MLLHLTASDSGMLMAALLGGVLLGWAIRSAMLLRARGRRGGR